MNLCELINDAWAIQSFNDPRQRLAVLSPAMNIILVLSQFLGLRVTGLWVCICSHIYTWWDFIYCQNGKLKSCFILNILLYNCFIFHLNINFSLNRKKSNGRDIIMIIALYNCCCCGNLWFNVFQFWWKNLWLSSNLIRV